MFEIPRVMRREPIAGSNRRARGLYRLITLALVLGSMAALTACGKDREAQATPPPTTRPPGAPELVVPTLGAMTDHLRGVEPTTIIPTEPHQSDRLITEIQVTAAPTIATASAIPDAVSVTPTSTVADTYEAVTTAEIEQADQLPELQIVSDPDSDAAVLANPPQQWVSANHLRRFKEDSFNMGDDGYQGTWPENPPFLVPLGVSEQPTAIRFGVLVPPKDVLDANRVVGESIDKFGFPPALELSYSPQNESPVTVALGSSDGDYTIVTADSSVWLVYFAPYLRNEDALESGRSAVMVVRISTLNPDENVLFQLPPDYAVQAIREMYATVPQPPQGLSVTSNEQANLSVIKPSLSDLNPNVPDVVFPESMGTASAPNGLSVTYQMFPSPNSDDRPPIQPFALTSFGDQWAFVNINPQTPFDYAQ